MQTLLKVNNPNMTTAASSGKVTNLSNWTQYTSKDPKDFLGVGTTTYKSMLNGEDKNGMTYKIYYKDSDGNELSRFKRWTPAVEVAFENWNGQHTSYCENYPEPNIYKSKRKIAFNLGYFSQFTRDALEAKGYDVDAMITKQNQWKTDFERDMTYATGEVHSLTQSKAMAELLDEEKITEGQAFVLYSKMKKDKNLKKKNYFIDSTGGKTWDVDEEGRCTFYNAWSRVYNGKMSGFNHCPVMDYSSLEETGKRDVTPDMSEVYSKKDGEMAYNEDKDVRLIKKKQLVSLELMPYFYCTANGSKGYRYEVCRIKILHHPPEYKSGDKRQRDKDWGDEDPMADFKRATN